MAVRAAVADGRPYGLILSDWAMPTMDGLQMARQIMQEFSIAPKPRIILATAYGSEDVRDEAAEIGIADVLETPVAQSGMLDSIMQAFRSVEPTDHGKKPRGPEAAVGRTLELPSADAQILRARLLVVEDDAINRQVAHGLLASAGFSTIRMVEMAAKR